jgi:hypothetical protein
MIVTFISIHLVIIRVVLFWRTYETHPALFLKSGCDKSGIRACVLIIDHLMMSQLRISILYLVLKICLII